MDSIFSKLAYLNINGAGSPKHVPKQGRAKRGLPRSDSTHDRHQGARLHLQVDVLQDVSIFRRVAPGKCSIFDHYVVLWK